MPPDAYAAARLAATDAAMAAIRAREEADRLSKEAALAALASRQAFSALSLSEQWEAGKAGAGPLAPLPTLAELILGIRVHVVRTSPRALSIWASLPEGWRFLGWNGEPMAEASLCSGRSKAEVEDAVQYVAVYVAALLAHAVSGSDTDAPSPPSALAGTFIRRVLPPSQP